MEIKADLQTLKQRIQLALDLVAKANASAEVAAYLDQGLVVNVRQSAVDQVEFTRNHGFGISVYLNGKKGSASTSDFSEQAVSQAVAAALDIARYTAPDPCSGLADAGLMAREIVGLDLHHPWSLNTDQAIELALACESAGLGQPHIENSDGASVATVESARAYGNSHGLVVAYPQTRHSLGCALIAKDSESMERGGWSQSHCDATQLPKAEFVGEKAAVRGASRLGSVSAPTGQYPVMFAAEIAGGLLGHFIAAISGGSLYRHASFLEEHLSKKVFPDWMNVWEEPQLVQGVASSPIDGDGLATREKSFVDGGVLASYVLSTYSGRKLGMDSTANAGGVRNLRCSHSHEYKELLKQMGRGLLVTQVMGQGVNIVSGHYSRGAAGFWVENGEIQYPVSEITIAGNLQDMFKNLVGVADDVDARGNIQVGSILVEAMTVAGK